VLHESTENYYYNSVSAATNLDKSVIRFLEEKMPNVGRSTKVLSEEIQEKVEREAFIGLLDTEYGLLQEKVNNALSNKSILNE
jgi:hypothetical protein